MTNDIPAPDIIQNTIYYNVITNLDDSLSSEIEKYYSIIALLDVLQQLNPIIFKHCMQSLSTNEQNHFSIILAIVTDESKIDFYKEIFYRAFDYILIRDIMISALNGDDSQIDTLNAIHPTFKNILNEINNNVYGGNTLLLHILNNMH